MPLKPLSDSPNRSRFASSDSDAWYWMCAIAIGGLAIGLGYFEWDRDRWLLDDSFITFRYAENWLAGHGLVWNVGGERVEGYSNFFWMVISAVALAAKVDPLTATRSVGVASYLAVILVTAIMAYRLVPYRSARTIGFVGAPLLLVFPDGLAGFAGTGLETAFVSLLLVLTGVLGHLIVPKRPALKLAAGSVPLLLFLTRLDFAPYVVLSGLISAADLIWVQKQSLALVTRELLLRYGVPAAGLIIYMAWRIIYFGDIYPNTYYAKMGNAWNVDVGLAYIVAYLRSSPQVILLAPFVAYAGFRRRPSSNATFIRFGALVLLVYALYMVKVGGDFMQYRFMFQVYPLFVCCAVAALADLARNRPRLASLVVVVAIGCSTRSAVLESKYHMETLPGMHACCGEKGVRIGKKLRELLHPQTTIATTMAGGIPYYSKLRTIDQYGMNDRLIAHQSAGELRRRGHAKVATIAYLRDQSVNLVIGHPVETSCAHTRSKPNRVNVFIRTGRDLCLRTTLLVADSWFLQHACDHPETIISDGIDCARIADPPLEPTR